MLLLFNRLIQSFVNGVQLGNLKSRSHKRITDLLHSVADYCAVLVHHHVHSFLLSIRFLFVGPKVRQGFSSCNTIKHSSHPFTFIVFNGASDKGNRDSSITAEQWLLDYLLHVILTLSRICIRNLLSLLVYKLKNVNVVL